MVIIFIFRRLRTNMRNDITEANSLLSPLLYAYTFLP